MFFCPLPMALRGNSSTTITRFGILNFASLPSSAFSTEASSTLASLLHTTTAVTPHAGGDTLAEVGMRHADHGGFDHPRHGVDLALDFLRIDVEAAGDHEVLAQAETR